MRHTTFRFALDATPAQAQALARHAGASRFAYNECLGFVTHAFAAKKTDPSVEVPWSSFDLINVFKRLEEERGRRPRVRRRPRRDDHEAGHRACLAP
jgi:putative transposase